ncbi:MAG TPA: SpoIIE family protein phosphatase [Acidimicrobiales bacterium]|nr:SpoIIE family protein phosphatase [Acidimicrobiales bacterium]
MLLWAHAVAIPIYAAVQGYGLVHTALESAIVPVSAVAAGYPGLSRRVQTSAASLGLLSSSAVLVHLSGGLIEMHFHFFVMVVVVSLYQDWLPFLGAIAYVLIHHGLLGALDPESVFNHAAAINHPWRWASVHALFIAAISAASIVNWRLNEAHSARRLAAEERLAEQGEVMAKVNEVGRLLSSDLELDHIVQRVTDHATRLTSAEFGAFFFRQSSENGESDLVYTLSGAPAEAFSGFPMPRATAVFGPTFLGEGVIRSDDITRDSRYGREEPHHGMPPGHLPVRSYLAVPVMAGDEVLGGLFFGHPEPGRFTEADERLASGIAAHAALAVRNAQRFANQREAAETLQHSLLPERLPLLPGVQTAAQYHAGGNGTEVGGDWYDVLQLPEGKIALVVGDVVGRGIRAAAIMGQLRNGLRAHALDGSSPAETLARLNDFARETGLVGYQGTVLLAVYDLGDGSLKIASAGHLPVAVRHPDGSTELLGERLGLPIGVAPNGNYRQIEVTLEPGSAICLFTDGLVEDRVRPLEEGLARLCDRLRDPLVDARQLCDGLAAAMAAGRSLEDDSAILVLVAEPLGSDIRLTVPRDESALAPLRAVLRHWLARAGVPDDDSFDILVAIGEASSNVIKHTPTDDTTFHVEGHLDVDLTLVVRNEGAWRAPTQNRVGGRGYVIMNQLMDSVEVTAGPPETTVTMRRTLARDLTTTSA